MNEKEMLPQTRNRKAGGGRIAILEQGSDINDVFMLLLKDHTADHPMEEKVKWTDLTCSDISILLAIKGFNVSQNIVRKLLKKNGYVKHKAFSILILMDGGGSNS